MMIIKNWIKENLKGDPIIWGIAIVLAILSTLVVYSAAGSLAYRQMKGNTEYYLMKHFSILLISLVGMWITHRIDYRYYAGLSKLALWGSLPLLIFTWLHGERINEASRWIVLPFINKTFQPSDLAQMALIGYIAGVLGRYQRNGFITDRQLLSLAGWSAAICGLIALTNLSAAILLFFTCLLMLFIGQINFKYIIGCLLFVSVLGAGALVVGQRGKTAFARIKAFTEGKTHFQLEQSYVAIATGGLYGKGPGKSDQRNFLPHPYSDFIYAVLVEEYGLLGGFFVLFLYLLLLYRGIAAMNNVSNPFGSLLAAGLSFSLVIQALVNMGIAVGLGPVTGLTLPFLSMGGTSLLLTGMSFGAILSVSRGETDRTLDHKMPYNTYRNISNQYKT